MTQPASLAPLLERFFTQRLMLQRQASTTPSLPIATAHGLATARAYVGG
jgi:hypothetical protein